MADDYTRQSNNPKLDAAILAANSIEEIRELMKVQFVAENIAQRERDGSYTQVEPTHALPASSAQHPAQSVSPVDGPYRRTITAGGRDYQISGPSLESLDQLEIALKHSL
jgi:hypothetical protein